jgi:hypothetical protein
MHLARAHRRAQDLDGTLLPDDVLEAVHGRSA